MRLYPSIIYCISTVVNQHDEFRTNLNAQGEVVIYDELYPCYTIFHKDKESVFMKNNPKELYLVLICLSTLALPLFDILEYYEYIQSQTSYQIPYIRWLNQPLIMPFCFLLLGWSLVHFLKLQKPNRIIFRLLLVVLVLYIIVILPWCLVPILNWGIPWPTYMYILTIASTTTNFVPALFVIIGMGLAYFRR